VILAQLDTCVPLVWLRRKFCVIPEHILLDQLKLVQLASQAFIVHQHQTRLLGARLVLTMMLSVKCKKIEILNKSRTCKQCPAGKYCPDPQMTTATPCPAGTYSVAGSLQCTDCPAGFSCAVSTSQPTMCGQGYFSLAKSSSCIQCTAGSECSLASTTG